MGQDLYDNPLGTDGFEFVEFTSPDPQALGRLFEAMGFTAVARHRSKNVLRYKQGDIDFILNMEPRGQAAEFRGAARAIDQCHGVSRARCGHGAASLRSSAAPRRSRARSGRWS